MSERTVILLPLHEQATHLRPRDHAGGLGPLAAAGGLPEVVEALTGLGRQLGAGVGLVGADVVPGATLLPRDVTVKALLSIDLAAQVAAGHPGVVAARGVGGDVVERHSWGVELVPDGGGLATVRWFWEQPDGTLRTADGASFEVPAGFLLLTATRKWIAPDQVRLRYWVNDQLAGEETSAHGAIGGGAGGTTTIGVRGDGAGGYERHLEAVLDDLLVANHEMSGEEIRATYRRIAVHQPGGVAIMRAHIPPGAPWSDDPESMVQRDIALQGVAVGYTNALAENLRDNALPDRAYAAMLRRWEGLVELRSKPTDDVDTRRARVLGFLGRNHGYHADGLRLALAELLGVDDIEDLEVLAFRNEIAEAFDELDPLRWHVQVGGATGIAAAGGELVFTISNTDDLVGAEAPHARMSLAHPGRCHVWGKVAGIGAAATAGAVAGLLLRHGGTSGDSLWFGVRAGATLDVGYQLRRDGVVESFVVLEADIAAPVWLRLERTEAGLYHLRHSTTGPEEGFSEELDVEGIEGPHWAGFGVHGVVADDAFTVSFDDFVAYTPEGTRPFNVYVYRDPALGGTYDLEGANATIRRQRRATAHAAVITSKALQCDDPDSGCDRGPMGAL